MWLRSGVAVAVAYAGSYSSSLTPSRELPYATAVALKGKQVKFDFAFSFLEISLIFNQQEILSFYTMPGSVLIY